MDTNSLVLYNISFALRAKIISDVTNRNRPTIFFSENDKNREFFPQSSSTLRADISRTKTNFSKNSFETVFKASKSRDRRQLVSAFQLTFKKGLGPGI